MKREQMQIIYDYFCIASPMFAGVSCHHKGHHQTRSRSIPKNAAKVLRNPSTGRRMRGNVVVISEKLCICGTYKVTRTPNFMQPSLFHTNRLHYRPVQLTVCNFFSIERHVPGLICICSFAHRSSLWISVNHIHADVNY